MAMSLDTHQICFLVILALACFLLVTERLRNDLVALLIILALAVTGVLSPSEALSGFSSEPAIIIASIFVMSGAFLKTGLADAVGARIGKLAGNSYSRALVVIMLAVSILSAFTHHVTTTAFMLPVVLTFCRKRSIPASKMLMPLSFAASLGTTITIIGAPAFLVASQVLQSAGYPGLGIFSIAPIGLPISLAGVLFMLAAGHLLLPAHANGEDATNLYRLNSYFTELKILPDSPFIDKTVDELTESGGYHFAAVGLTRSGAGQCRPMHDTPLQEGDVLWISATPEDLISFRQAPGIELHPVEKFGIENFRTEADEEELAEDLVQAIVAPTADIVHRSIQAIDFRARYGAIVLGLWRRGAFLCQEMSSIALEPGDVLVLQGDREALSRVANDPAFLMLVPFHGEMRLRRKARRSALVLFATIAAATLNVLSLEIIMLAGAAAMVLLRCITPRQAYRSIDVKIFVFIAGAIPLGDAMEKTGTAALLAGWLQGLVGGWSPFFILLFIFAIVAAVTQFMSDAATTALFGPIAIALAAVLGHRPEPFVITVAMAAVTAFLTPIGHHGNLLVYGPGRYRFSDFSRVGTPLTVVVAVMVAFLSLQVWR